MDDRDGDHERAPEPISDFDRARRETVRYHEELYAVAELGEPGTWLARPHPLLTDALALLAADRPVVAYDLGAGIGRHTIPLLEALPEGSTVWAVDLLDSALEQLRDAVPGGLGAQLRTRAVDLSTFEFETGADLVFAFSAVEHLPDLASVRLLLERARAALTPGGVLALGFVVDRFEIDAHGDRRPALLESAMTSAETLGLLSALFPDFTVAGRRSEPSEVREQRGGEVYTLASTLLTWLARKPDAAG
ncbi:MAG TPA: class I SAM-dependent methyltransferase [Microbacterium sp.]|nr:class I SAM-dependent methyltransferase [Microbacterium sp.]